MAKRGAMELSIGTIVVLVIAMSMLILGLILVRTIFSSATNAITEIDKGTKDAITKAFANSDKKLVFYPSARTIEIKQRTQGQGFAFSLRNLGIEDKEYTYTVGVDSAFDIKEQCGSDTDMDEANSWLIVDSGSISLGKGAIMEEPELILFNIPENAPPCTIPYAVNIKEKSGTAYTSGKIYLTVMAR